MAANFSLSPGMATNNAIDCIETDTDLLSNLFKGYKSATDDRFLKYTALKEEYYEEGNNLGAYELMSLAKNKWQQESDISSANKTESRWRQTSLFRQAWRQTMPLTALRQSFLSYSNRQTSLEAQG
jgi:hypothetical protein